MSLAVLAYPPDPPPSPVAHAVLVLRNELQVLRDGRRALLNGAEAMSQEQRDHLVTANLREIREVQEALRRLRGA